MPPLTGAFLHNSFAHADNVIPVVKTITWLLLSRLQSNKPHRNSPKPSEPCLRNQIFRNLPPELSGTFRNLPPEPAPATHTGTHRSLSGLKTPLAYAVGEKLTMIYFFNKKSASLMFQKVDASPERRSLRSIATTSARRVHF